MKLPKFETKYVVIYSTIGMRERHFDNEKDANEFAETVKGSVCPINVKIIPHRTAGESRKYNNLVKQAKRWGY
jgi:hypothetical protein